MEPLKPLSSDTASVSPAPIIPNNSPTVPTMATQPHQNALLFSIPATGCHCCLQ